ncbi:hypothetical protein [Archangium violaceum]|uniref:hypothetical protein n=1 Tax=Archangium violaceum TaxID=83451 RepID=UPI001F3F582D|nr:hypothetical protein [Archangium violaceum]
MSISAFLRKLAASSLGLLLVSCTVTKPVTTARSPTGPHDLGRFVLVLQETPDGRVTHDWRPLGDFDLKQYQYQSETVGIGSVIKRTSAPKNDDLIDSACFEVWEHCMARCNESPLPPHAEHYIASYRSTRAALKAYCTDECRKESDNCRRRLKRQAAEVLEFRATGEAVDWLKRHKEEIAVGATVIITGVVFYVVMSSGGILILAPAFLLTSPNAPAAPHLAEVFQ